MQLQLRLPELTLAREKAIEIDLNHGTPCLIYQKNFDKNKRGSR